MRRWSPFNEIAWRISSTQQRRCFRLSRPRLVAVADLLRAPTEEILDKSNHELTVRGWVSSIRKQKNVAFAMINDGSSLNPIQAVLTPEQASGISYGAAVELKGTLKKSAKPHQASEFAVERAIVVGNNDAENNPVQPKYQTPEFLRTVPHLRSRISSHATLLRLRSKAIAAATKHFDEEDWIQCHTPIITSSDCEGAGEVFTVSSNIPSAGSSTGKETAHDHFFRDPKYLTVSAQLHLEALAQAATKVWTLSPTFRAEKSDTSRHLSEFYMLEAEVCFVNDLSQIMDEVEDLIKAIIYEIYSTNLQLELFTIRERATSTREKNTQAPQTHRGLTAEALEERWKGAVSEAKSRVNEFSLDPWPRITYTEAIERLQKAQSDGIVAFEHKPTYQDGLQIEHERFIARLVGEGSPIFVTDYPRHQKPFYMAPSLSTVNSKGTEDTVSCFDLLVPDLGEIVGGSIRKHDLIENLPGENLEWYQDLRRFGSAPHGGFGLGFDRLLCYLGGVENIRDVVAFPRWVGRCEC